MSACGCQEHCALLNAIRLRDPAAATRLMLAHLQQLESQLQFAEPAAELPDFISLFGMSDA
ncbi:FCD domain-containing protein [Roseateles sp. GG27B]